MNSYLIKLKNWLDNLIPAPETYVCAPGINKPRLEIYVPARGTTLFWWQRYNIFSILPNKKAGKCKIPVLIQVNNGTA